MDRNTLRRMAWALVAAVALSLPVRAQTPTPTEYQVKAAFLYNFAKFTEWPDDGRVAREGGYTLCIVGRDPFGAALDEIAGRQVHGLPLRVRRAVSLDTVRDCQILFVSESEERRLPELLRAIEARPVLTVSDIDGFADAGGMIGLALADRRLQFDVNLGAATRSNLRISSQLLKLARSVRGAGRG